MESCQSKLQCCDSSSRFHPQSNLTCRYSAHTHMLIVYASCRPSSTELDNFSPNGTILTCCYSFSQNTTHSCQWLYCGAVATVLPFPCHLIPLENLRNSWGVFFLRSSMKLDVLKLRAHDHRISLDSIGCPDRLPVGLVLRIPVTELLPSRLAITLL